MTAESEYQILGKPRKLVEGMEKATGRAQYAGDITLPGMLHARPILSPYAHARIVSIDCTAALQVPGVVAVLTADDLPTRNQTANSRQSIVLAKEAVLFRGHPVAVIVANSEAAAQDGATAVLVDYEPLPVVANVATALAADAPIIWPNGLPKEGADLTAAHTAVDAGAETNEQSRSNVHDETHIQRGSVDQGFAAADAIVERSYTTASVHQAYLEPHAAVAEPDSLRNKLTIYTSTQDQFGVRNQVARLLGLSRSSVTIVPMTVGGGFGAKYGIIEPLVGAVAMAVQRPIRLVLTRSEDFLTTTPAQVSNITLKIGAKRDGTLTAIQAKITLDNGVYPFALGFLVGNLIAGYYKCANLQIDCYEVITHKPQAGAYRAPGAPQATFALESSMDELAYELGMDPLELRLKNAVESGDPMGEIGVWSHIGLKQCLERARAHPLWAERAGVPNQGVGLAIGGWPCNVTPAAAICRAESDGMIRVYVGSVDLTGVNSTFAMVAAEILGVSPDQVEVVQGDTRSGPFAGPSGGSQITYSVAAAVANAAQAVKQQLLELAEDHFEARIDDLEIKDGNVRVRGVPDRTISIGSLAAIAETKRGGSGPVIGEGRAAIPDSAPGFAVHLAQVRVDPETGQTSLLRYVAIHDIGFALNPLLVEGQIHGGAAQGIGWALHEAMRYDEHGELLTGSLMDYDLPHIDTVPSIEVILVDNPSPSGPFGARGIGEPPIIPGGAVIANAIRAATGVRVTELPIRDETLWQAMQRS